MVGKWWANGGQMVGKSEFMIIEHSNAIGALDIQGNMGAIPEG